jgi:hypothetical protein
MDESRFDRVIKTFGRPASRRSAFGILSAFGLAGGAALRILAGVTAKKKRKHKKKDKKPKPNAFGCFNVGQACRGNSANCCSGICEGTKPKKGKTDKSRCVAHNAEDCPAGADACTQDAIACGTGFGRCYQTTGQASFCAGISNCAACTKDVDCEALGYGLGAACLACADGCPQTGTRCAVVPL